MDRRISWPLPTLAAVLGLCLLLVNGCGGSKLVTATGRLTYKGAPVPSTIVTFWPAEEGARYSTGVTDDDGKFKLRYTRTEDGVLRGQHTVVLKYEVGQEEELRKIPPKASSELKAVIARHGDLRTSSLKYEIKGNGQVIDVKLD